MKKTIIVLLILAIALTGCKAKEESKDCDYTTLTQQNIDLVNQYNTYSIEKNTLQTDYNTLKEQNNKLKIDYLNLQINNTCNTDTSNACASFIRQIARLDTRLEECYQMNVTFNCSGTKAKLNLCEEKLVNITSIID